MDTAQAPASYSSKVALNLIASDQVFPLAQIGPSFVVFREPTELPPGPAQVVMEIDGRERRWTVNLPVGSTYGLKITPCS